MTSCGSSPSTAGVWWWCRKSWQWLYSHQSIIQTQIIRTCSIIRTALQHCHWPIKLDVLLFVCRDGVIMVEIWTDQIAGKHMCAQQCVDRLGPYSRAIIFKDNLTSLVPDASASRISVTAMSVPGTAPRTLLCLALVLRNLGKAKVSLKVIVQECGTAFFCHLLNNVYFLASPIFQTF